MNYISINYVSEKWQLTKRRITQLCNNGKINGAIKKNGIWLIPENVEKPIDGRKKNERKDINTNKKLPIPIGESNFINLINNYYYVDKTLLIKDFLDTKSKVTLFTRPRRFGKTLNMEMLKTYFEISDEDTSKYFQNLNIWKCSDEYRNEQGKYPVIFLSFKDVKFNNWSVTFDSIKSVIANEYKRHIHLLDSNKLNEFDKKYYNSVLDENINEANLATSIKYLSDMLMKHYNHNVIIIIDEYDTPIQQGYSNNYYNEIISFMRNLFSGAFKDNNSLAFGFLTGILHVAKESIFSGLNNIKINSILDERYSEYFGFTKKDVQNVLDYYGKKNKYKEISDWYNGYQFGDTNIYNPWSVLNYIDENCNPKTYWQFTGDSSIIKQIICEADEETSNNLRKLIQGESITTYIDTSVVYPEIKSNPSTIYSFLLATGYLKIDSKETQYDENAICEVSIPNKEISYAYSKEILSALSNSISQSTSIYIRQALLNSNIPLLKEQLEKLLKQTISSFDYAHENFYHGFLLGICAIMNHLYKIDSNKESGYGRYDIQLLPYDKSMYGIIIEIKVAKEKKDEHNIEQELIVLCKEALKQVNNKEYINEMKRLGISKFLKIGISFYKKHIQILYEEEKSIL